VTQDIRETLSDNPKRQKKIKRKRKRKRIRQRQLALTHILYQVVTYKVKLIQKKKKKKTNNVAEYSWLTHYSKFV
jgi:hypothetical protein